MAENSADVLFPAFMGWTCDTKRTCNMSSQSSLEQVFLSSEGKQQLTRERVF